MPAADGPTPRGGEGLRLGGICSFIVSTARTLSILFASLAAGCRPLSPVVNRSVGLWLNRPEVYSVSASLERQL